jgi:hypothetical protein
MIENMLHSCMITMILYFLSNNVCLQVLTMMQYYCHLPMLFSENSSCSKCPCLCYDLLQFKLLCMLLRMLHCLNKLMFSSFLRARKEACRKWFISIVFNTGPHVWVIFTFYEMRCRQTLLICMFCKFMKNMIASMDCTYKCISVLIEISCIDCTRGWLKSYVQCICCDWMCNV